MSRFINYTSFFKKYKGSTFRCLLMGTSKNEAFKKLNNSVTYDRGVL